MQVARALVATLPADVDHAAGLLEASQGPPGVGDDLSGLRTTDAGLAGWLVGPLTKAVALMAAEQAPARGLQALHAMTQRLSAEFAVRPFLVRHPRLGFETLAQWPHDPSAHVRRLVSEGSRSLIKQGDQAVLAAWGIGAPFDGTAALALTPARLTLGGSLRLALALRSTATQPQRLAVDCAVHPVKAGGHTTAKVFKGWLIELTPGETRCLEK